MLTLSETELRSLLEQLPVVTDDVHIRSSVEVSGNYAGSEPFSYGTVDEMIKRGMFLVQKGRTTKTSHGGTDLDSYKEFVKIVYSERTNENGIAIWRITNDKYCLYGWYITFD